ncbi:MAG: sn-glycerol-3-phosphate ABC transporter ATP-binding protein UgpC [Burkholderiales bacterium]|nr:sn-glycerol-3-phosphate ABC transporter ATP-binding protein UgpC [Burkholderiales bacterium]
MSSIALRGLVRRFGAVTTLHGIDLEIADGAFVVLVGPSGCGKSTLLRLVAGLDQPSAGQVLMNGRVVNDLGPAERDVAMVFQNYSLYPHMTVRRNLAFGLENLRVPPGQIAARVDEAARVLELTELLERKPAQLSGGQRQRVAMGRAMVRQPQAFLFDEPLSNLDAQLRASMRVEIKKLHRRNGRTLVYVTHDQVEAMTLADIIVVMRTGRIEQAGSPAEVFERPANLFVAGFIGSPAMNLRAVERHDGAFTLGDDTLRMAAELAPAPARSLQRAVLGIRPDDLRPAAGAPVHWPRLTAAAKVVEPMGSECIVTLGAGPLELTARLHGRSLPSEGDALELAVDPATLHWFDPQSERALYP